MNKFLDDIRFIMPLVNGFVNEPLQESGYDIKSPYYGNSFFPRVLREMHFRLGLPFKCIWFNNANITKKEILFLSEALIIPDYLDWLHKKNPDSKIIIFYTNKVNYNNNPNKLKRNWCSIWTCDKVDSEKYNLNLYDGVAYFKIYKVKKEEPIYDVFYIGKDKGRLDYLLSLEKKFNDLGLKTYINIVAERRWFSKRNKRYRPIMPYKEVLENLGKSKAILHLSQGAQYGITMRIMESLIHNIKLITDCSYLVNYDFYNENNIFILGKDDFNRLSEFMNTPYEKVDAKVLEHIYFEDMLKYIVKNVNEKSL